MPPINIVYRAHDRFLNGNQYIVIHVYTIYRLYITPATSHLGLAATSPSYMQRAEEQSRSVMLNMLYYLHVDPNQFLKNVLDNPLRYYTSLRQIKWPSCDTQWDYISYPASHVPKRWRLAWAPTGLALGRAWFWSSLSKPPSRRQQGEADALAEEWQGDWDGRSCVNAPHCHEC